MKTRHVVAAIAALAMLGARTPAQARVPPQGAPSSGQVAFDRVCKVCHGPEARGDAGPRLVPFSRDDEELLGIVREGIGQMPPISARELPDESVAQIAAYLRWLSRSAGPGFAARCFRQLGRTRWSCPCSASASPSPCRRRGSRRRPAGSRRAAAGLCTVGRVWAIRDISAGVAREVASRILAGSWRHAKW